MYEHVDLSRIPVFLAVADCLNFTEAAFNLYSTQSSVSKSIAALEASLGFPLFIRRNKKVILTPAGDYLYKELKEMMFNIDNAFIEAKKISEGKKGSILIGFSGYLPKTPGFEVICSSFFSSYPEYELELKPMAYPDLIKGLQNDKVDAILYNDLDMASQQNCKSLTLMHSETILLYNKHIMQEEKTDNLTIEDFKDKKFISVNPNLVPGYYAALLQCCKAYGFHPNIVKYVDTIMEIVQYVSNNDYVTILSSALFPVPDSKSYSIVIPFKEGMNRLETILAWKENNQNPALSLFVEMAQKYLESIIV